MRTKKTLSVLLAAIMMLSLGMTAVFATEAEAEDPTFELQASAQGTWPSTVTIERDSNNSGWDYATVIWKGFTVEKDSAGKVIVDSYYDQKIDGDTTIEWKVIIYPNGKAYEPKIHSNSATAATKPYAFYTKYDGSNEMLCLYQGTTPYYGKVDVSFYVTAKDANGKVVTSKGETPAEPKEYVTLKTIEFVDQTDFFDLLEDAKEILDKSDRYDKDYITLLTGVYNGVKGYTDTLPVPFSDATDAMASLKEVLDDAPNHYKLIGWDFLDNIIAKPYYWIVDFFDEYSGAIDAIKNGFTVIGNAFGFLVPIFQVIFGLIV